MKIHLAAAVMVCIAGCGSRLEIDGDYIGNVSFWGTSIPYTLHIEGNRAVLNGKERLAPANLVVQREDARFVLRDSKGVTLIFTVKDLNTLECAQCQAAKLPTLWERSVN